MVAYSFHKRFADLVAGGSKTHTIRAHRKRHARVGEPVQLYSGMRTKHCRKLVDPDPICCAADPIAFIVTGDDDRPFAQARKGNPAHPFDMDDAFARADGFEDLQDMAAFWLANHREGLFQGVLISWETQS